ncbi:DUF6491 family protein [Dyella sp. A6]|uniref:DUF6491 family protein n=1 Tax=Dyella aluminiiresistens TaxID=3069105 RepID=UPI002E762EB0|nr:DUF6491 family protein [Dyella sp. A6]
MKLSTLVLSVLAVAFAVRAPVAAAHATDTRYHPMRPVSSCLRSDRINEWHVVNARTIIARTGPYRYLVKLQNACTRLEYPSTVSLHFHSNRANEAVRPGAICGEVGETVSSSSQPPCAIQSVRRIDKAEFDRLRKHAVRHGSGADQPTRMN